MEPGIPKRMVFNCEVEGFSIYDAREVRRLVSRLVGMASRVMDRMRAFLVEFGVTPAARTRVQIKLQEI